MNQIANVPLPHGEKPEIFNGSSELLKGGLAVLQVELTKLLMKCDTERAIFEKALEMEPPV